METLNILLFVVGSFFGWLVLATYIKNRQPSPSSLFTKKSLAALGISTIMFMPFNIGGDIWTIAGNARTNGSIYSVFSVYQDAKEDAFSLVNIGYQSAGKNTLHFIGMAYQSAGKDTNQVIGLAHQNAGNSAAQIIGIAYQNVNNIAVQITGIAYQNSGNDALQFVGIAYQNSYDAKHFVGVTIQNAILEARNYAGVALWQRAGEKIKVFAVWSRLEVDKAK